MSKKKSQSFTFKAGTILAIGDHPIVLTEDSTIHFDGADDESKIVGLLVVSKNLEVNRDGLAKNYNSFGMEIPGEPEAVAEPEMVADEKPAAKTTAKKTAPKTTEKLETADKTDTVVNPEDLATEAELRADLKEKTVVELKAIAKTLEIVLPRNAVEDEIIEKIIASLATREIVEKILENEK